MKSDHLLPEVVVDELGDKVTSGLAEMIARTRDDLASYRRTFPSWVASATERGLFNWCHDRAWSHALEIFDGVHEVSFVDAMPTREVWVGTRYRLRVKKHDADGRITTYPTQGALDFYTQNAWRLDGLDEVHLAVGYRWHRDLREVGPAVLSLRDGLDNLVWMHDLPLPIARDYVAATPIVTADEPSAPQLGSPRTEVRRAEGDQPR